MKTKKFITRRVLQTELSMIVHCIDKMNFGYARELATQVLDRVKEYDMVPPFDNWANVGIGTATPDRKN